MEATEQGVPTLHTTGSNHSLSLASVTAKLIFVSLVHLHVHVVVVLTKILLTHNQ